MKHGTKDGAKEENTNRMKVWKRKGLEEERERIQMERVTGLKKIKDEGNERDWRKEKARD